MFEFLINPKKAEKKPWEMFFIGLFYSVVAITIVDLIFAKNPAFRQSSSILILVFIVMLCLPFVYYLIIYEERKDIILKKERKILKEHGKALAALSFLFLGLLVGFTLAALLLPGQITKVNFQSQAYTYCLINDPYAVESCVDNVVGGNISISKPIFSFSQAVGRFFDIFINNVYVLLFALLFSFIFGSGAIFILSWNASVIAIAISALAKANNFGLAFIRYMLHGIFEIAAYFIAGLAGGIISIAVIKHDYKSKNFWIVIQDSLDLIIIAILLLIIAGLIEVFISPYIL